MGKTLLYVGGLSETATDHHLRALFTPYGTVERAYVILFKHTGKSAGYGFVEMDSGENALKAVVALEGTQVDGQRLRTYVTPSMHQSTSRPS